MTTLYTDKSLNPEHRSPPPEPPASLRRGHTHVRSVRMRTGNTTPHTATSFAKLVADERDPKLEQNVLMQVCVYVYVCGCACMRVCASVRVLVRVFVRRVPHTIFWREIKTVVTCLLFSPA